MKEGDIIEWRGLNKTYRGVIVKCDPVFPHEEGLILRMDNGKTFPLKDLRHAKSAKLIEK